MYVCTYVRMYVHVCTYVRMRLCMYTYIYIHTHTHTSFVGAFEVADCCLLEIYVCFLKAVGLGTSWFGFRALGIAVWGHGHRHLFSKHYIKPRNDTPSSTGAPNSLTRACPAASCRSSTPSLRPLISGRPCCKPQLEFLAGRSLELRVQDSGFRGSVLQWHTRRDQPNPGVFQMKS